MSGFSHDIAGGNGALVVEALHSPNYSAAAGTGWTINADGSATFYSVSLPNASGTKVTFAATAPSSPNVGDVWYDTAAGLLASQWNGTTWAPHSIGAAAIGPGQVLFSQVTVTAGSYAGQYEIVTDEYTDGLGNQLAVVQWLNISSPAVIAPYLAAVTGAGSGAIASLHSGQEDGSDAEAVIWALSAEASSAGGPTFLADCTFFQPLGGTGPSLFANGAGWAVDSWHPMTLQNGWANASSPAVQCKYRLTADNQVEVIGTANGASASGPVLATLPAGRRPASQQPVFCQDTVSTAGNYYMQCSTGGVLTIEGTAGPGPFTFHGMISLDA